MYSLIYNNSTVAVNCSSLIDSLTTCEHKRGLLLDKSFTAQAILKNTEVSL